MPLPWVRLDANISTHDKTLNLLSDPSPKKWQAMASYMFSLGWAGGQGTDGHIPHAALGVLHATPVTARLLVKHKLWKERANGWEIVNYAERQELAMVTEAKRAAMSLGGKKSACIRNHGPDCGCWREVN